MKQLSPVFIAFSMFSRLPVPRVEWTEKNRRYALCAFPLVGLVQGGLLAAWGVIALKLQIDGALTAVIFTLLPLAFNGGIHMDGLCDTADALASHASREKKLEILKDPHIGAFGVLVLAGHLLTAFALFHTLELDRRMLLAMPLVYALSRAWSGYAVLRLPSARQEGLAWSLAGGGGWERDAGLLLGTGLALSAGLWALLGTTGLCAALACILTLLRYRRMALRQFGGVTGDLAGWYLQTAELWMLGALSIVGGMRL